MLLICATELLHKRNLFIVFNNTLFIICVDILSFNIQNDNIKYAVATSLQGRLLVHVVAGTLGADDVLSVLELQFYIPD